MLASIGFISTGVCFGIFAYTFYALVVRKTKLALSQFTYAYYSLAVALIWWGIAAAIGTANVLQGSVIVGNGLILVGTLFMLDIWLGKRRRVWLAVAALIAIGLLFARVNYYSPAPYMKNGLLIFDTQLPVALVLGLLFVGIWLPINVWVAKRVAHTIRQDVIASTYADMFIAATVSLMVFLAVKRPLLIALSFTAIGVCFLMLIKSNLLVAKLAGKHRGK